MSHTMTVDGETLTVSKVVCLARNYAEHARELGAVVPKEPLFFLKPPSCLLPGGGEIRMPTDIGRVDVETEGGQLIGRAELPLPEQGGPGDKSR